MSGLRRRSVAALFVGFVGALAGSPAVGAGLQTLDEVQACTRANRPSTTLVQEYKMESVDRIGSKRTSEGRTYWKKFADDRSKALVRVTSPPDVRGTAVLIVERPDGEADIFSYLPELQKVRRIQKNAVQGSFLGSDFSYEDFERLQSLSEDADSKLLPAAESDGRPVYVVESRPARGTDSEYSRIVAFVDQETCVPLRTEAYDHQERLLKVFTTPRERIVRHGESWIPEMLKAVNEQKSTQTVLDVGKVKLDEKVPNRHFSESALIRRR